MLQPWPTSSTAPSTAHLGKDQTAYSHRAGSQCGWCMRDLLAILSHGSFISLFRANLSLLEFFSLCPTGIAEFPFSVYSYQQPAKVTGKPIPLPPYRCASSISSLPVILRAYGTSRHNLPRSPKAHLDRADQLKIDLKIIPTACHFFLKHISEPSA